MKRDAWKKLDSGLFVRRRAFRAEIVYWSELPAALQEEHSWASEHNAAFVYSAKHGFCRALEDFCQRDPKTELPGESGAWCDTFFSGYSISVSDDCESALLRSFCC